MPRFGMFRRQQPQPQADDSQPAKATWSPSYENVREARVLLKSLNLPTELVLDILDRARYWPSREFAMKHCRVEAASLPSGSSAKICLGADICSEDSIKCFFGEDEKKKIKEIEFEIVSKDQGWTSERTQGAYSFFQVGDSSSVCVKRRMRTLLQTLEISLLASLNIIPPLFLTSLHIHH